MLPPVARRFIAGKTIDRALNHVENQNEQDIHCLLNQLGEHYHDRGPAEEDTETYRELVRQIGEQQVDASISVKPSQIGLFVDEDVFAENFATIVETAADHDVTVWLDMEDHTTTDTTIKAYRRQVGSYSNIGICLQANLERTAADIQTLKKTDGWIRLVKGAYSEPEEIAYQDSERIDENYRDLLKTLFDEHAGDIAVGTHDPAMIEYTHELHEQYDRAFQHQMLMGVRMDRQRELAEQYDVAQYVPYGDAWMAYFYRRMREKKENILFALRAILTG